MAVGPDVLKARLGRRQHRFGETRPDHRAAARIGTLRQAVAVAVAGEQPVDLAREGGAVAEVDQHAVAVRQDLGGMDIGRGNHRLADADRIGGRARGDLRRVQIGRGIDIGRLEIVDQFGMLDEAVDKVQIVADPLFRDQRVQAVAIELALIRDSCDS